MQILIEITPHPKSAKAAAEILMYVFEQLPNYIQTQITLTPDPPNANPYYEEHPNAQTNNPA